MATKKKLLQAAAGSAGGAGGLNVEDVFSTYLYEGNEGIQTITNDISLGQSFSGTGSDGSALFGGNGDYVTVSGLSSSISGDFTIELFGYNTSPASEEHVLLGPWGDGTHGSQVLVRFSGETLGVFFPSKEVGLAKSIHGIGRNEWFHLAITRESGTLRIFANGAKVHSSSYSTTIDLGTLYIGSEKSPFTLNGNWEGNISNVRVSDTTAFYTSDFTLPTANLTNISNTDLLTLQGSTPFVDNSSNSLTVTEGGSVSAASGGPFPVADGEGGMAWVKARTNGTYDHYIMDTERGVLKYLKPNGTSAEASSSNAITSFNSNGFTIGGGGQLNNGTDDYASWTFRQAPKFFTCLTYSGTGTAQNISHDLGAVPAAIFVKQTSNTKDWNVYHRGVNGGVSPENYYLQLNSTIAAGLNANKWNNTAPTDTVFTVGTASSTNASGETYVAYLFAHNDGDGEFGPDGDADIIKCGSYTGNGSTDGPEIDLGWEPQWVMIKASSGAGSWYMFDNMRGIVSGGNDVRLQANQSDADFTLQNAIALQPTGFKLENSDGNWNGNGATYIYIAIRRGPMAVPTDATDVFAIDQGINSSVGDRVFNAGFPVDLMIRTDPTGSYNRLVIDRLRGNGAYVITNDINAEADTDYGGELDDMEGVFTDTSFDFSNHYAYMWQRRPNYFDIVAYTGNATAGHTIDHNLGVAPEMMWVKRRDSASNWFAYHKDLGNQYKINLNDSTSVDGPSNGYWNSTTPSDAEFTLGTFSNVNGSGTPYIAYLFASLDGVSKVGSYTGTGATLNIDCGFSSGARFVLIKRTDNQSPWWVWDSERGIVSGNDPYLELNSTAAENTSTDYIDPYSSGFALTPDGNWLYGMNYPSGSYIFYAIA